MTETSKAHPQRERERETDTERILIRNGADEGTEREMREQERGNAGKERKNEYANGEEAE